MPIRLTLPASQRTLRHVISKGGGPLLGLWACAASPIMAEIMATSGADFVLIDGEHSPNDMGSLLAQLHAVNAYDAATIVRVPINDERLIKQYLDLGVRNLLVPMVDTPEEAAAAAARVAYPTAGVRGVGSALARASMWNRVPDYLANAREFINLIAQIESVEAVANVSEIAATDGVDAIFIGPADLAADMGMLGRAEDAAVVSAVETCIAAGKAAGKLVGTNAFNPTVARHYIDCGADFVLVGADVTLAARASEAAIAAMKEKG